MGGDDMIKQVRPTTYIYVYLYNHSSIHKSIDSSRRNERRLCDWGGAGCQLMGAGRGALGGGGGLGGLAAAMRGGRGRR
jgi:hypothetical protein